jgi:hypothetical protein
VVRWGHGPLLLLVLLVVMLGKTVDASNAFPSERAYARWACAACGALLLLLLLLLRPV